MAASSQPNAERPVDIVFVHGLRGNGSASWCKATAPSATVESLLQQVPGIRVREYDGKKELHEEFDWESFLDIEASSLLKFLDQENSPDGHRQIILIGHGLGGNIIKNAIKTLIEQHFRHHFLDLIIAIIFVGTPHFIRPGKTQEKDFCQLLKADLKSVTKRTVTKRGLSAIVSANMAFDEWRTSIPVLSIYETRETKLRGPLFFRGRDVLAPLSFVKTRAVNEHLAALDLDMCDAFNGGADGLIHQEIKSFIRKALNLESAKSGTARQSNPQSVTASMPPTTTTNLSFLSQHSRSDNSPASSMTAPTTPPRPVARMSMTSSPTGSFETGHSFVIVTPTTKLPCFFVDGHPRNPVFVGRGKVLEKLDDYLLVDPKPRPRVNDNTAKRACAIWGVGGVGKTQIAVEWAYSRRSEFQAVIWANAQSREQLDISFSQIAEKLGLLTQANSLSPRTIVREVKDWLADPLMSTPSSSQGVDTASGVKPARASWLLIFDSVGDLDDLHSYWPEGDEGSILVTCRDPKIEENPSFACNSIELDSFSQDDALDFFKKSLGGLIRKTPSDSEETTTVALQHLADRLHYFPLHMTAVAGAMKRLGITAQEFLTYYQSEIGSAKLFASEVPEYEHRSIASSWNLKSLSQGAAALLNVASLLSTTGISEDILRQKPEGALAIDFPQDAVSYFEDLAVLSQSSFAIRNIQEKSIFVHDIVQDVTRAMLVSTPGRMERTFEATVKLVSAVWPFVTVAPQPGFAEYRQNRRWNQCERIYPHLLSLSNVFERYSLLQASSLEVYDFTLLLSEMAWYQLERADPTSCQAAADLAFKIVEERGLPEFEAFRAIVSAVHGTLQQLAFDTNDPKSCFFHAQQALTIQEDLCAQSGKRTQKLAVALSEMGKACSRNKLYRKALDCYEESRRIREAQPGFKPAALYTYHLGRGHALWLLGRHDEASSSIKQALQLQVETYGVIDDTTSHRTGLALFALGNIRLSQGRLLESHSLHQRALRQFKASVGVNHMYYAAACYKDGEHNMRFNEYEFSKLRFETALRIYCDDKHYRQEIARTKFQLGKALLCLGEADRGGELMKDARELYAELVPDNSCAPNELNDADFDDLICFWFR